MAEKKKRITKPKHVIAVTSVSTSLEGRKVFVHEGECFRADEPIVKKHPWLFQDAGEYAAVRGGFVEQATAGPGEVRNVTPPQG